MKTTSCPSGVSRWTLVGFRPETALLIQAIYGLHPLGNTEAVKLFNSEKFCDVPGYASAQALDFLAMMKNSCFRLGKLHRVHPEVPDGH
jgi:hypothetical protein